MRITLKNYRCFPDSLPATFEINPGFTAFIGPNNAGKSSILKFFFEFRGLFQALANPSWVNPALGNNEQPFSPPPVRDIAEVFSNINERDLVIELADFARDDDDSRICPDRLELTVRRAGNVATTKYWVLGEEITPSQPKTPQDESTWILNNTKVTFAPIFRECEAASRTLYVGAFRNILNVGSSDNYFDIKTGQAFVSQWRDRKGETTKQSSRDAIRITNDIRRIFEYDTLEINPALGDTTLQLIANSNPYMLSEIGSGLTQFLVVLANAASQNPSYILIDEPELNLHPTLQLDFLTALGAYTRRGVIFSTHSVGLAKSAAEQIYLVRRQTEGQSEVRRYEDVPRLVEYLGELGFSGYSELGFSKLLLIEGPSELKTIEQFLRMAGKNHQVVMMQLGGSSMINGNVQGQLEELKRITPNIRAIIDSEKPGNAEPLAANRVAFKKACVETGVDCLVLERRTLENYFTDEAVKRAVGSHHQALLPYEKLGELRPSWGKANNWRIASEMKLTDLQSTDLGAFLEQM